jgi:hypothetical protein
MSTRTVADYYGTTNKKRNSEQMATNVNQDIEQDLVKVLPVPGVWYSTASVITALMGNVASAFYGVERDTAIQRINLALRYGFLEHDPEQDALRIKSAAERDTLRATAGKPKPEPLYIHHSDEFGNDYRFVQDSAEEKAWLADKEKRRRRAEYQKLKLLEREFEDQ